MTHFMIFSATVAGRTNCSRISVRLTEICREITLGKNKEDEQRSWKMIINNRMYTMRKCGLCCRLVSVRPSVTFMYCIQTARQMELGLNL